MSADGSKAPDRSDHKSKREVPSVGDWPVDDPDITAWTDHYFNRTKQAVDRFGDQRAKPLWKSMEIARAVKPSFFF